MVINLFAVRLILKALGVEDYGIYNVIAGVVTSISCITNVVSASTQRFYSIAQGDNNINELQAIYSTSLRINFAIVLILFILAETIGLWFVNNQLVIPVNRLFAANIVYQAALISFVAAFIQTPFSAAIIAHENMGLYALITLGECILKFGAAAFLFIIPFDSLMAYSVLLAGVSLSVFASYVFACKRKYIECKYTGNTDRDLRRKMLSFSGWTLLTACASICMYQANTILVNIFFGPIVNASRGIALQLNASLSSFTGSFLVAVRPPIMKLYAEKKYNELNTLFNISNKFIFYLLLMVCIPLVLEMETVLRLWLNHSDDQTVLFSRLTVVYGMILALNNPISYIVQATGKVKKYCLYVEVFTILCMPLTLLAFKLGYGASYTFYIMILCVVLSHIARILYLKVSCPEISLNKYLISFIAKATITLLIVSIICYFVHTTISSMYYRLAVVTSIAVVLTLLVGYLIGLSSAERTSVRKLIFKYMKKA